MNKRGMELMSVESASRELVFGGMGGLARAEFDFLIANYGN